MAAERPADVADPVGYFLQDMTYHGKSDRTRDAYERVLREFESFLGDPSRNPAGTARSVDEATHRDCMAWIHTLRNRAVASSTVATYASYLHRFYAYMAQVGVFDSNPMGLVMEEMDERIDTNPARRELSVPQMREFVRGIHHPLEHALVVTLLKTGMRVGELCNLDLRDLSLSEDTPLADVSTRATLDGRGPSIYVSADPSAGGVTNGETRTASNKRKRSTVIPVDDELEAVLLRWLAIRPDTTSLAEPLFVGTASGWGKRLVPDAVHHIVTSHATDAGWYRTGGDREENVTPHYFRHFFTTHLRDRTGDRGIVKYLRGDVAGDIIDTYTHNWGDRVRETYESNVYSLR
ncbi:integrase [Haloferax mediterranei ATCC 33500]|uniref:Integrase n=1 Tax=Haloferax mediterranei (strain ATCC 33500 / DSM 1411 / JCM 8866 / NBRC 14739 / NCIMB 2177 / R-4) TaxID=523841 RepID=I3R578_HALMT|nr:tyrosine-type recombinase/integrase [Haloferax mediterranei]AFK19388.1 tyrosine recombinase xerC [Haloferax mediterranei ATCC 33500]AHZ21261.1 integrase [Haloferax mediterranei ATCC 33500]EMA04422.1 tyrosine recombinase XerC [Haloferax mediterranei ATCC 33500]MDX5989491.1 tyrosine-type recombinase/integrase [Haloferax mediterranei ATCC 33500]QCQ75852.1 integrase [Haloferax mediterranei ATCC 33500]